MFRLEVWLLPSSISVYLIYFVLFIVSLSLYCCLWLPEFLLAHPLISLSIISLFEEAVELVLNEVKIQKNSQ